MTARARGPRLVDATLLALAIGLVAAVVGTQSKVTTTERESRSLNLLGAWREDEVSRIAYQRQGERFSLERRVEGPADEGEEVEHTWFLAEPYDEEVDPFAMEKLLGTLQYASWERHIKPEEVDRAAFGMDEPRMVIEIEMGDITYRLRLGADAASPPGAAYMEVTGEGAPKKGIYIVGKSLLDELGMTAEAFRERYVMPYLSPALKSFRLTGPGGERAFRRAEWDGWRFDGMFGEARAGREPLDRVVLQFARTIADDIIEPAKARKALAGSEKIVVTQTPKDPKLPPGRVEIGGECPGDPDRIVALRLQPDELAGCVTRSVWPGLTTPAPVLVDRTLFYMRPDEVEVLEIDRSGKKLRMERKEEGFVLREPKQGEVDGEAGNARLEGVLKATGRRVESPDLAALGLDPPDGKVVIRSGGASEEAVRVETVQVSAPRTDGKIYALREHDGVVLELVREVARALTPDAALIRSRHVFDFRQDEIRRVEVSGAVEQTFERDEKGGITLLEPEGFAGDAGLAMEVIDALRTLTAERWVADEDDGTFGLDEPQLQVRFMTRQDEGEPVPHTLVVGRPTTSGHFATIEGDGGVFVMPRRLSELLGTLVIDRTVFSVDPSSVQVIELVSADRRVELERLGDTFIQNEGEQLGPGAVQRVVDTLSTLRAEAAIAVGPPRPQHGLGSPILAVRTKREAGLAGSGAPQSWEIGAGDTWRGVSVHYARAAGVDAVYVITRSQVQTLLDAL